MEIIEHTIAWCRGEIFRGTDAVEATPLGRAIGLSTILLGFAVLFLDHFSGERAEAYHAQVMQELERRVASQ